MVGHAIFLGDCKRIRQSIGRPSLQFVRSNCRIIRIDCADDADRFFVERCQFIQERNADREAVQRGVANKARTIRIPVHVVEKLNKIGRAERKLVTELGREPTAEEIAEATGIEPEEVESIKRSAQAPVSLEKPVGDEEESEFGQFIADERAESPYERAAEILTKEALREALENLSYRERRVLELRYGLGGEHPRTLDEVGRTFNVTRERIRQIENQSLKKLQSLAAAQKLRDAA